MSRRKTGALKEISEAFPVADIERRLGVAFPDRALLVEAFTHSSYANECSEPRPRSNERLEFLGDAVIALSVSHYLWKALPNESEGSLARRRAALVSEDSLARRARALDLGRYVLLGTGEERSGGRTRPSLLCDLFEAVVGAIFLAHGWAEADRFVLRQLAEPLEAMVAPVAVGEDAWLDGKSRLQEHLQQTGQPPPSYRLLATEGPPHERSFTVSVEWGGRVLGYGRGRSRKAAEQAAALEALKALGVFSPKEASPG